jgi:hypothetical protein
VVASPDGAAGRASGGGPHATDRATSTAAAETAGVGSEPRVGGVTGHAVVTGNAVVTGQAGETDVGARPSIGTDVAEPAAVSPGVAWAVMAPAVMAPAAVAPGAEAPGAVAPGVAPVVVQPLGAEPRGDGAARVCSVHAAPSYQRWMAGVTPSSYHPGATLTKKCVGSAEERLDGSGERHSSHPTQTG